MFNDLDDFFFGLLSSYELQILKKEFKNKVK